MISYKKMDIQNTLFGPLREKSNCLWFYFLSILGFIWLVFYIISALIIGVTKKKPFEFWLTAVAISGGYLIFWYQNRILYSMCETSIGK